MGAGFVTTGIACFIAGLCAVGFVSIWFSTAYRELSEKRRNLDGLLEQFWLHQNASAQARDGPERKLAQKMLATNSGIFREAVGNYNHLLKKPLNRIPALLLGFHPADEAVMRKRIEQRGTPLLSTMVESKSPPDEEG